MLKIEVKNGFLIFDNNLKFKKAINISKIHNIQADEDGLYVFWDTDNSIMFEKDLIGDSCAVFEIIMTEWDKEIKRQRVLAGYPHVQYVLTNI